MMVELMFMLPYQQISLKTGMDMFLEEFEKEIERE